MTTADAVRAAHRPAGHRLGIAVGMPAPDALVDGLAAILRAGGQDPRRRLARLRPRYGETATRPEDVAYFIDRYGHEYTVVVLGPTHTSDAVIAACRAEGCALVLDDSTG
ncbi:MULTISPECIES: hypothetical protein [unclassified Micromonospora]|uniref:hypothetical protein n=1 Tax=unclassified Micromonospora TaxID=2617518 RepID=UPI00364282BE